MSVALLVHASGSYVLTPAGEWTPLPGSGSPTARRVHRAAHFRSPPAEASGAPGPWSARTRPHGELFFLFGPPVKRGKQTGSEAAPEHRQSRVAGFGRTAGKLVETLT